MEESEAKCDKCDSEVRPEPTSETLSEKILFRPEQLVAMAVMADANNALIKQNNELLGTLLGIGFVAIATVLKYTVFY